MRLLPPCPPRLLVALLTHVLGSLLPSNQPIQVQQHSVAKLVGTHRKRFTQYFQTLLALWLSLLPGWYPYLLPSLPAILLPLLPPPGLQQAERHQLLFSCSSSLPDRCWCRHPGCRSLHCCLPHGQHCWSDVLILTENPSLGGEVPTLWGLQNRRGCG